MRLNILFFSLLRDVTGQIEIQRDFPTGTSVADLLESLYTEWPNLRAWDGKVLVAADLDYVDRNSILTDGQEIAIMPPVQGG
jgi:molybdopterin converting factor small subunit